MSKSISVETLQTFDVALYLNNEEAIEMYLRETRAANDADLLARAIDDVARARQMNQRTSMTHEQT